MTYLISPNRIGREIDQIIDRLWSGESECNCAFAPRVNIRETENDVVLVFEVPGVEKNDIKVGIENGMLTVSGERKIEPANEQSGYVRNEILGGTFSRSFTLPDTVDTDKIEADYKHGMLTVKMARKEEAKPKQIEVKVN